MMEEGKDREDTRPKLPSFVLNMELCVYQLSRPPLHEL